MRRSAGWLAAAAEGRLISADARLVAGGQVCTDTRLLRRGDMFVALEGAHVDGSGFIADALARGADGVIARPDALAKADRAPIAIAVEDPLRALGSIAQAQRAHFGGHAIGVTGSSGKTSTCAILASLLSSAMETHATRNSFNTDLGVASTIAGLPESARALVLEVSMQTQGEIAEKAALLRPTSGLITNIGPVHLQTAGSITDVARNKAELIAALPAGGPCVLPFREPLLDRYIRSDLRTITHGPGGDVSLRRFTGGEAEIDCGADVITIRPGFSQPHNLNNLVAAVALLHALAIPLPRELSAHNCPLRWQLERLGEVEVILDCFNNSPAALRAALEAFAAEPARRRFAVLGEFGELGVAAPSYHRAAGAQAKQLGIDAMIVVGERAREYLGGYVGESHVVQSPAEAREMLEALARPGDRVLVKGPRSSRLERILL